MCSHIYFSLCIILLRSFYYHETIHFFKVLTIIYMKIYKSVSHGRFFRNVYTCATILNSNVLNHFKKYSGMLIMINILCRFGLILCILLNSIVLTRDIDYNTWLNYWQEFLGCRSSVKQGLEQGLMLMRLLQDWSLEHDTAPSIPYVRFPSTQWNLTIYIILIQICIIGIIVYISYFTENNAIFDFWTVSLVE
jgi:hypothetical protein